MADNNENEENGLESELIIGGPPARSNEVLPANIYILPVTSRPFFPGQAVPLLMSPDHWRTTFDELAASPHDIVGIILTESDSAEVAKPEEFRKVGTACRVHRVQKQEGRLQVLVECLQRFEISQLMTEEAPFCAHVSYLQEKEGAKDDEIKAYAMAIINTIKELLPLNPLYVEELRMFLDRFGPDDPSHLSDFAASLTTSDREELQDVLEATDLMTRMEKVLVLLHKELELARAQNKIRKVVEDKMQTQQREFFLREQLKVIQQELGIAKDDKTADVDEFRQRVEGLTLPADVDKRIEEELGKLSLLETGSPEYGVTRNYLDWLTVLPWGKNSEDNLDLKHARQQLDADHYGLDDVKKRIEEFLAVGITRGEISGSIILLVGPPGVGKTSLGKSIAAAMGRKFYRFSVGGTRDEAEIKGHRRTYIGAMPGKFVQALKDAGSMNPVIMLDEIDKIGNSYQGDPASALLEALDPEQNADFLDHYLDVRADLSKVLFICTANQLDSIPDPLLDRMEVIRLSGYLGSEKLEIAKRYLLPRQLKKAGLKRKQVQVPVSTLRKIIEDYARYAGVRRLDKQIGALMRKSAVRILDDEATPIKVQKDQLRDWLGSPLFQDERRLSGVGVITGLAWTTMGGATLHIEAAKTHNFTRGFKLTGQLGDVMRESAEIAYGYIVGHAQDYQSQASFFEKAFIHLHVPAGATPKDGPSAGITMASALLSLARGKQLARKLAMTGEMTLTGEVLPVGGIREKVIAAKRAKIRELILPQDNRDDFERLPEYIRKGLKVHFATHFNDVEPLLFGKR
ncbi:MAG: endopeptidase La [gamma proteobacterium symbiont of Bathyaustriella thionipta]|nr:endopeptidase La [gamma proteobacterium symbiont of Bathyaustriella thionipta]